MAHSAHQQCETAAGNHAAGLTNSCNLGQPIVKQQLNLSRNFPAELQPLNASEIFLAYTRPAKGIRSI
jgi:hypothetical protein